MSSGVPYSPFNRQRRGTEAPQSERVAIPRKAPPPPGDLGLPNASFLQDLTGTFRNSVTDPPTPNSESGDDDDSMSDVLGKQRQQHTSRINGGSAAAGFYNIARKVSSSVSSFASGANSDAPRQLSDAELEAQAIKEREHSRREAERILLQEAEERRHSEDLLAQQRNAQYLPPLRPRRSTIDVPSSSPRGGVKIASPGQSKSGWWSMAKQKLTSGKGPEKEEGPLTPAQEIIRDAKIRERELLPAAKTDDNTPTAPRSRKPSWFHSPNDKDKEREGALLSNGRSPSSLPLPVSPPQPGRGFSASPRGPGSRLASPATPPRVPEASRTTQLNFSPSPVPRSGMARPPNDDGHMNMTTPPQGDAPSLYTQFNPATGALDVPATLLTVTARFEKLERWTVNHVRALEERMKDVERFLVDKETKEAEVKRNLSTLRHNIHDVEAQIAEAKDGLPAAVLSNLLMPTDKDTNGAASPTSHGGESSYHSATGSPSIIPYGAFRRSPSASPKPPPRDGARDRSFTAGGSVADRSEVELGPNGTVKPLSSNLRNRLPYPSGDYFEGTNSNSHKDNEAAPSLTAYSHHPSADPYTPPTRSAFSLASSNGSPVLPPPRAVSPFVLSPIDADGKKEFASSRDRNSGISTTSRQPPADHGPLPEPSTTTNSGSALERARSPSQHQQQPSQESLSAPMSPPQSASGSRAGSRGNSISPTPRKRYTVALSGRLDGGPSPSGRSPGGDDTTSPVARSASPLADLGTDDIVGRVYGIGLGSASNVGLAEKGPGSSSTRIKVHTALFTSSPSFKSTSSLAYSLRTPEAPLPSRKRSGSGRSYAESGMDGARTEYSSPTNTTELSTSSGEKTKSRSLSHDSGLGKLKVKSPEPVVEEAEGEGDTSLDDPRYNLEGKGKGKERFHDCNGGDGEADDDMFKIGATPVAPRRISSPPPSSPTPVARSRIGAHTRKPSFGSGGLTTLRSTSPLFPATQTSPSSDKVGVSIPRSLGGLGSTAAERNDRGNGGGGVMDGSVSSWTSASTASSSVTSSSTMTASTRSTASGTYRTTTSSSPPHGPPPSRPISSSIPPVPRVRAQTALAAPSSNGLRGTASPTSAASFGGSQYSYSSATSSSASGGPGSPSGSSDRGDRSDADVFASRGGGSVHNGGTFVDPYVERKRARERRSLEVKANAQAVAKKATDARPPGKKPPVGELVAFFQATHDQER